MAFKSLITIPLCLWILSTVSTAEVDPTSIEFGTVGDYIEFFPQPDGYDYEISFDLSEVEGWFIYNWTAEVLQSNGTVDVTHAGGEKGDKYLNVTFSVAKDVAATAVINITLYTEVPDNKSSPEVLNSDLFLVHKTDKAEEYRYVPLRKIHFDDVEQPYEIEFGSASEYIVFYPVDFDRNYTDGFNFTGGYVVYNISHQVTWENGTGEVEVIGGQNDSFVEIKWFLPKYVSGEGIVNITVWREIPDNKTFSEDTGIVPILHEKSDEKEVYRHVSGNVPSQIIIQARNPKVDPREIYFGTIDDYLQIYPLDYDRNETTGDNLTSINYFIYNLTYHVTWENGTGEVELFGGQQNDSFYEFNFVVPKYVSVEAIINVTIWTDIPDNRAFIGETVSIPIHIEKSDEKEIYRHVSGNVPKQIFLQAESQEVDPYEISFATFDEYTQLYALDFDRNDTSGFNLTGTGYLIYNLTYHVTWENGTGEVEVIGGHQNDSACILNWFIPKYVSAEAIVNATIWTEVPDNKTNDNTDNLPIIIQKSEAKEVHRYVSGNVPKHIFIETDPYEIEFGTIDEQIDFYAVDYDRNYSDVTNLTGTDYYIYNLTYHVTWENGTGEVELIGGQQNDSLVIFNWFIPKYVSAEGIINMTLWTEVPDNKTNDNTENLPIILQKSEAKEVHRYVSGNVPKHIFTDTDPYEIEFGTIDEQIDFFPVDYDRNYSDVTNLTDIDYFIYNLTYHVTWENGTGEVEVIGGQQNDSLVIFNWFIPKYVSAEGIINMTIWTEVPDNRTVKEEIDSSPILLRKSEGLEVHTYLSGSTPKQIFTKAEDKYENVVKPYILEFFSI